ncbi:TetR/AcrR family transcriptional regulator [Streptomyces decoyicus]|uniref:TetR/AcrR family transcriptional regulator n=1 Tax=Streptomyces decoyicus TaxID=249567 RepID=UPI002E2FB191|nr:helix-turn-helix domain-containing protein [Streptomyces decoyicus]
MQRVNAGQQPRGGTASAVDDRHRRPGVEGGRDGTPPVAFDRDRAILDAARLFWRRGYSGTSTRDLTAALGLSTSSLYAAFGSKAGLFEEAVRTYAERYREIYRQAVAEKDLRTVIDQILIDSVHE